MNKKSGFTYTRKRKLLNERDKQINTYTTSNNLEERIIFLENQYSSLKEQFEGLFSHNERLTRLLLKKNYQKETEISQKPEETSLDIPLIINDNRNQDADNLKRNLEQLPISDREEANRALKIIKSTNE